MSLIEKAAEKLKGKEATLVERAASALSADAASKKARVEPMVDLPPVETDNLTGKAGNSESTASRDVRPSVAATSRQHSSHASRSVEIDLETLKERGFIAPGEDPTITAEEFRIVKRSLLLKAFGKGGAVQERGNLILVSSCQPSEGKTFSAINLALSMATEQDLRVLLVDADFAKPDVLKTLGIPESKGLVDVISDPGTDIGECLLKTNIPGLTLLPAGKRHHLTTELLASDRMAKIISEVADRYRDRVIIFDSPPVLANTAASVLGLHVGQCLFVVEAERTSRDQLEEALSLLENCPNISLMLNKSRFVSGAARFGSYYGYGYGYGYGNDNKSSKK